MPLLHSLTICSILNSPTTISQYQPPPTKQNKTIKPKNLNFLKEVQLNSLGNFHSGGRSSLWLSAKSKTNYLKFPIPKWEIYIHIFQSLRELELTQWGGNTTPLRWWVGALTSGVVVWDLRSEARVGWCLAMRMGEVHFVVVWESDPGAGDTGRVVF